jgi:hypothetical protein
MLVLFRGIFQKKFVLVVVSMAVTRPIIAVTAPTDTSLSSSSAVRHSHSNLVTGLLLDVDNTLYREQDSGIEAQIVQGTHAYCKNVLGVDKDEADRLYLEYGSTIEGLRQTLWKDLSKDKLHEKMKDFYHAVYDPVDPSSLVLSSSKDVSPFHSTGYTHATGENRLKRQLLKHSPKDRDIILASNSPSWHVQKVIRSLGLAKLKISRSFTPDRLMDFPTKHNPNDFFADIDDDPNSPGLTRYRSLSILDDSKLNLERIQNAFPNHIEGIHHIHSNFDNGDGEGNENSLSQALLQEFGLLDPSFQFFQVRYLESKNKVDRQSIHVDTWNSVVSELQQLISSAAQGPVSNDDDSAKDPSSHALWIVDVGAGLLSVLDLLLHGEETRGLKALSLDSTTGTTKRKILYTAYESNQVLYESCHSRLISWGFEVLEKNSSAETIIYHHEKLGFQVQLVFQNFVESNHEISCRTRNGMAPNLIVGCCFADLMDPQQLVPDLMRSFGLLNGNSAPTSKGTLVYFPVTFTGTTQFLPPRPFEAESCGSKKGPIPSDTIAFRSYANALEKVLGHNLNPDLLKDTMEDYGAQLLAACASNWKIDPRRDAYLHETMLYFFGRTAGPELLKERWDASGWIRRARDTRPTIEVSNTDLLFRVPSGIHKASMTDEEHNARHGISKEILFTKPYEVTAVQKDLPTKLGARQVLSKYPLLSICQKFIKCFSTSHNESWSS